MIQTVQTFTFPKGEPVIWYWDHTESLTGWVLSATLTDPHGVKTVKAPTIGVGPNDTLTVVNTRATVDYTGTSEGLAAGRYSVTVTVVSGGPGRLKAVGLVDIIDQG